jgi:hypothetical protein
MKLFVFLTLTLSAAFSNAMTIKECNLKTMLTREYVNTQNVKLSDGRLIGSDASNNFQRMARLSGVRDNQDELGVIRYRTTTESSLVETDNGEINSCEGKNSVYLTTKCTASAKDKDAVCETFCSREWNGWECR